LIDLHPHVEEAADNSVRARLATAWRHINDVPDLRRLLMAEAAVLIFIQSGGPIEVSLVKETLNGGDRGLGLVLTSWGAGAILGSLAFARLERRSLATTLSAGTLVIGAAYLGLAAAPSLAFACVAGLVGGIGNSLMFPSLFSLVQRLTPPRLHGRLMGAVESLGALGLAVGLPLGGLLVALSSPRTAFVVVGVGVLVTAAALVDLAHRLRRQGGRPEVAFTAASAPPVDPESALVIDAAHSAAPDGDGGGVRLAAAQGGRPRRRS
jgi:MFS family permease